MHEVLRRNERVEIPKSTNGISSVFQKRVHDDPSPGMDLPINWDPSLFPTLVDVICLNYPYDGGTDTTGKKAENIPSGESSCYKWMSRVDLARAEISIAAVHGQLFGVAYTNLSHSTPAPIYSNDSCGCISKIISLGSGYDFDVYVVATIGIVLPDSPEAVYFIEPGNLNLSSAGVNGRITNTLSYRKNGMWKSASKNKQFLHAVKSTSGVTEEQYENSFAEQCEIEILAGTTEFVFSSLAQVNAFTSLDVLSGAGLDTSNYGLALVDLRSRLTGSQTPIALRPFTTEYKAASGGIRIASVCFEIFKAS
jgi:hypothetical protein